MNRLIFLFFALIASLQSLCGREVALPNNLSIEIPDGFKEDEYAGGFHWSDGKNDFYFVPGVDTIRYDRQKVEDKMHEYVFNLKDFVEFEKKRENMFSISQDYTDRYMYDVNNKSKLIIRTAFVNNIPYLLAYSNPQELDMESYSKIASSIKYYGSWWQRLKASFLKSPLIILLMPILLCFAGGLLAMFIPKKLVSFGILIFIYIIGWPLMTDWTVGIVFYLGWTLLIWIFQKLDFKDFLELTQAVGN